MPVFSASFFSASFNLSTSHLSPSSSSPLQRTLPPWIANPRRTNLHNQRWCRNYRRR